MIASADIWLNGNLVAEKTAIAGAYPVHELDVTRWVRAGVNTLALRVRPADPRSSLSIGWVDWNPTPPDNATPPVHKLAGVRFLEVLQEAFRGEERELTEVAISAEMVGNTVARSTKLTRDGIEVKRSKLTKIKRAKS